MASKDTGGGQQRANRSSEEVEEQAAEAQNSDELKERQEKLSDDVDAVLDEIDEVLESNAEDFVRQFVQRADSNRTGNRPGARWAFREFTVATDDGGRAARAVRPPGPAHGPAGQ